MLIPLILVIPAAFAALVLAPLATIPDIWKIVTKHITPKQNPWPYVRVVVCLVLFFVALKVIEEIFA